MKHLDLRLEGLEALTDLNQLVCINVKRFRGGLVLEAHRRVYHSTLGLRVIKKKNLDLRLEGLEALADLDRAVHRAHWVVLHKSRCVCVTGCVCV